MTAPQPVNVSGLIDQRQPGRLQILVFLLCAGVAFLDGFDTQIIAYLAPAISAEWNLQRGAFGAVFGSGLFGLTLGALIGGPLADRWGRKVLIAGSCVLFGIFATATAFVQSLQQLTVLRFLTGLGLGSAMPNLIALTSEYAPSRNRTLVVTLMFSAFPLGSVIGGFLSAWWIPALGWRSLFYLGGLVPLALSVLLTLRLPESLNFLVTVRSSPQRICALLERLDASRRWDTSQTFVVDEAPIRHAPLPSLFRQGRAPMTATLWLVFFMNLLVMYFMVNWLPTLLMLSGYALSMAIVGSTALNLGGVVGGVSLASLTRRHGSFRVLGLAYALVALVVAGVAGVSKLPALAFPAIFLLGFGVVGSQFCLNALAAELYPTAMRATGVGWALGVGRIGSILGPVLGGQLLRVGWTADQLVFACVLPALFASFGVFALGWLTAWRSQSVEYANAR